MEHNYTLYYDCGTATNARLRSRIVHEADALYTHVEYRRRSRTVLRIELHQRKEKGKPDVESDPCQRRGFFSFYIRFAMLGRVGSGALVRTQELILFLS